MDLCTQTYGLVEKDLVILDPMDITARSISEASLNGLIFDILPVIPKFTLHRSGIAASHEDAAVIIGQGQTLVQKDSTSAFYFLQKAIMIQDPGCVRWYLNSSTDLEPRMRLKVYKSGCCRTYFSNLFSPLNDLYFETLPQT